MFTPEKTFKHTLVNTAIIASLAGSFSVVAEETAEAKAESELEKITVTSRRKTETIIEIPMAVSSVSAMEIQDRNYTSATDIYRTLAGAAMPRSQLILRGLSGGNSTVPDTTATFVDDVPFTFTNLSDVERVEVLRGPQGTLYGSNAIGGTVRIITKKPQLDEFELFGSVQAGSEKDVDGYDTNFSLGVNIPLVENKLALRVNGNLEDDQLPFVNMNTGVQSNVKRGFIRSQLLWQATDDIDVTFGFSRTEYRDKGASLGDRSKPGYYWDYSLTENADAMHGYDVGFNKVECPASEERPACRLGTATRAPGGVPEKYQIWERIDQWDKTTNNLFTLNINDENFFDFATLTYAGSFRKYKEDSLDNWTRLDADDMWLTWIINDDEYENTTHELRLQNLDVNSPLSWTVGMFYEKFLRENLPNYQNQYHEQGNKAAAVMYNWYGVDWAGMGQQYFNNPQKNWNSTIVRDYARELAFFADVSYTFDLDDMGELEINGGIRRYDLKDETIDHSAGIWTNWDAPWVPVDSVTGGEESGNRYKFSASWRPEQTMSVYALYSEGYRPGGNNGPLAGDCQNDPAAQNRKDRYNSDEIKNYELGLKASVFDRKFDFAAAVYQIDWTGIKTDVYMDTCGFSYTTNGGTAESKGFEFESTAHLADDLKMTFNTSYTKSEITEDNASISAKKGDDMTMVPEWNGYLALDKTFSLMGKEAAIRADWTYYGDYKTHFNVKPEDEVPSYNYFNLSARYEVSDDVRLSIHLNNVFDKEAVKYKRARSRSDSTVAQQYIEYLNGRTITVRLDYTFF